MDRHLGEAIECLSGKQPSSHLDTVAVDILENIILEPDLVDAVWHPLGFMYIELLHNNGISLRIHVWSLMQREYASLGWLIHKHNWSLSSYVICGSLKNYIYELVSNREVPTHRIYTVEYQGLTNHLLATEELVSYKILNNELISKGGVYRVEPGIFHRTETKKDTFVATMIMAVDTPGERNEVLGIIDGSKCYTMTRPRCHKEAVRDAVCAVLKNKN